jgi:hypothetical protein
MRFKNIKKFKKKNTNHESSLENSFTKNTVHVVIFQKKNTFPNYWAQSTRSQNL